MNSVFLYLSRTLLGAVALMGVLTAWAATSPFAQGYILIGLSHYQKELLVFSVGVLTLTIACYWTLWGFCWKSKDGTYYKTATTASLALALLAVGCAYLVPFVGTGNLLHPWQTLVLFFSLHVFSPLLLIKAMENSD